MPPKNYRKPKAENKKFKERQKPTGAGSSVSNLLDTINNLTLERSNLIAEVNRLQADNERLSQFCGILLRNGSELFKEIQTAKSEAYKEFAERLKEKAEFITSKWGTQRTFVAKYHIDNLLKELVGDNK